MDYSQDFIQDQFAKGQGRGPEYSALTKVGSHAILGFHRLAINGLNAESNQPIQLDNLTLICNGEIYNYKQLYDELGITPNSGSDCEIILHLYKRFGIERTLQLLDGVFAFALIDYNIEAECATAYIARDPFGVRPLYYLSDRYGFYGFASELKCLSEFLGIIDHVIPGTYSTFKFSYKVSAKWVPEELSNKYHIPSIITTTYDNDEYSSGIYLYKQSIRDSLCQAVEKRCSTTERQIACLLSGGLDSSLITALVSNYHKKNGLPNIETYSIGLEGSVDLHYAKIVANYLGTKHTEVILSEADFLLAIPEVIQAIESYDTTSVRASIGNYLLGKYIKEHSEAKVIFNGDGSDELTGGYLYFHKAPNTIEFDLECRRLLSDIYLFDVLRSDKSISSHGLEPRTPFLDRGFVQTYLSIPSKVRCHSTHGMCEKHLLRFSFHDYHGVDGQPLLPNDILWRTKEAFSDGVSKQSRSLYEIIQDYIKTIFISNPDKTYEWNGPKTEEQEYYRWIFESYYPNCGSIVPYMWMPRFVEGATDASARTLAVYKEVNAK
jgi:asparagine synthase (glutamine-hydrolysing)